MMDFSFFFFRFSLVHLPVAFIVLAGWRLLLFSSFCRWFPLGLCSWVRLLSVIFSFALKSPVRIMDPVFSSWFICVCLQPARLFHAPTRTTCSGCLMLHNKRSH